MKIKVGVIFGGETVEHEVSIISAIQAMEHFDKDKYEVVPIYIAKDKIWYTNELMTSVEFFKDLDSISKKCKSISLIKKSEKFYLMATNGLFNKMLKEIDVAFPIVHGNNVEDGTLAGFLDTIGIPYVGSKVLGSALGQDKVLMKQVFASNNLPIVDYIWFYDYEYYDNSENILNKINTLGYPVVVKPASLGSSVGINYVKDSEDIILALEEAVKYDTKIIVEKAVPNLTEVNCSVLGNYEQMEASVIEEVVPEKDILTYTDKYIGGSKGKLKGAKSKGMVSTTRIIPANIAKGLTEKIQDTSKAVFKVLNLSGVCRIDYLINSKTNEYYINEPNTIPGSLAFYLWEAKGKSYKELLDDLIMMAIKDYKENLRKTNSFTTNILSSYHGGIKK